MGKKKKSSDFQKVKLRVGRQLPKGLNVTNTSFSTRKIILKEQLKDDDTAAPKTHRKLGLKDLLSRLDHYRASTRHESLAGLKELFTANPAIIQSHLSSILEKSCQLIIDKDAIVRKSVLGVLGLVFKNIDSQHLAPFFPVVSSYLCCAMTHIVSDIRSDSLLFLDLLLESFPDLTVMSGNKIFQNFLDQISSERDPRSVNIGRTLLADPNEKLTSQKWRSNVLKRMDRFLQSSLDLWNPSDKEQSEPKVVVWDCENPTGVTLYFGGRSKPILDDVGTLSRHYLGFASEETVQLKDKDVLKNYIAVLIPLLIETWVEASPSSLLYINQDAHSDSTMDCVLQVIKLLGECAEKVSKDGSVLNWFRDLFASEFQKHFMTRFPYARCRSVQKKKQKKGHDEEVSYVHLNLAVCEIFTLLAENAVPQAGIYHERICEYLTRSLMDGEISGIENVTSVIKVVSRLLAIDGLNEQLLEKLRLLCQHWQPSRKERMLIMDFFIELVSGIRHKHLISCPAVTSWLRSLPKEIVLAAKSPNLLGSLLKKVTKFATRGYPAFLQGLQDNDAELIALIASTVEEEECYHLVILCSLLPKISLQTFRSLAETVRSSGISQRNATLLLQTITNRFSQKKELGFDVSEYLGCLMCIITGLFKHEGNALQQQYTSNSEWCVLRQFLPSVSRYTLIPSDTGVFERHCQIIELVVRILLQFPDMNYLERSLYTYFNSILELHTHLPVHSVVAIMRLVSTMHASCNSGDEDVSNLLEKLHVSLASLTLAALSTCCCLEFVTQDDRIIEELRESVLNFVQISECAALVCDLLFQQLQDMSHGGLSLEEAECIGGILLQLLRSGLLDRKSIKLVGLIIQHFQGQSGMMDGTKWKDVLYEFKLRCQHPSSRHKKMH